VRYLSKSVGESDIIRGQEKRKIALPVKLNSMGKSSGNISFHSSVQSDDYRTCETSFRFVVEVCAQPNCHKGAYRLTFKCKIHTYKRFNPAERLAPNGTNLVRKWKVSH